MREKIILWLFNEKEKWESAIIMLINLTKIKFLHLNNHSGYFITIIYLCYMIIV